MLGAGCTIEAVVMATVIAILATVVVEKVA
jgi:hypothetical protein